MDSARRAVSELGLDQEPGFIGENAGNVILGEIPLVSDISRMGDQGRLGELFVRQHGTSNSLVGEDDRNEVRNIMEHVAKRVWESLSVFTAR